MELPITPIVCKPSEAAIEWALKIANIDPQRTVRKLSWTLDLVISIGHVKYLYD